MITKFKKYWVTGADHTRGGVDGYKYSTTSGGYDAESLFSSAYNDMQFSEMISSMHSTDDSIPSMFGSIRKASFASSSSTNHRKQQQQQQKISYAFSSI